MSINTLTKVKVLAGAASVVVLAGALAACGSSGSSNNGGSRSVSSAVVTQQGTGQRLSGTYSALDMLPWVPKGLYPKDLTEIQGGSYNTDSLVAVNAKYDVDSASCTTLVENTAGPGWGEEAYLIDQGENAAATNFYGYSVYEFPSAGQASHFVTELATRFAGCGSFTLSANGGSLGVSMGLGPASEAQVPAANTAVDLRQTITNGGKTVVGDYLYAADGNIVVCVAVDSSTGTLPTEVSGASVAQALLTSFARHEAAWVAAHQPSDYTTATGAPPATPGAGSQIRFYSTDAVRAGGSS